MLKSKHFKMEKYFHSFNKESGKKNSDVLKDKLEPGIEYRGYHKFGRVLGRGRFGTVIECSRKADNLPIAMKFFKSSGIHKWIPENTVIESDSDLSFAHSEFFECKSMSSSNQSVSSSSAEKRMLPSEVACLIRAAKIPGVVKILDYLPACEEFPLDHDDELKDSNDDLMIGIVFERVTNEICFFDYLIQKKILEEDEARFIVKQLVQINLNLLQAGILHGDLKSENILIDPKTKIIKLIDFGSAQLIDSSQYKGTKINSNLVKTFRGTNLYKPPEYLMNKYFYPRPSTVWTIGIILYDMVCGYFPFKNDADILDHQHKEVSFTSKKLSQSCKTLIKKCLAFYVADRINIDKILLDPWMQANE